VRAGLRCSLFGAAAAVVLIACGAALGDERPRVDLLVSHGTVIDGAGAPARRLDIGVTADQISFIGDAVAAHVVADRTIAAAGMIVAPAFIDPHTHADRDLVSPDRARREKLNPARTCLA
jgi:N-acyl-D-aspartate/D-glutamate deacylase